MQKINVLAVIFFLIGLALHTLAQVDAIARSKNNPMDSRVAILKVQGVTILIRGGVCLAFFVLWLQGQLVGVMTALKIPLPDTFTAVLNLHVGGAIAFLAGYAFDSGLSFFPGLKSTLPAAIDTTVKP